jgi:hypothetical protein
MDLSTMRYLEPAPVPTAALLPGAEELSWTEVTKGLLTVLGGYVIGIANLFGTVVLLWIVTDEFKKSIGQVSGDDFSVLLVGGTVSFFASLYSSYLILRGKWRCVMNAPERRSAKWLMFASMICICAGPALHIVADFISATHTAKPGSDEVEYKPTAEKSVIRYTEQLRENDSSGYLRLAGSVLTPLGPVFFVLFLRAIHGCLGSFLGARFTEMFLVFVVLLFAASLCLLLDPRVKIRFDLLAFLGIGWLVTTVWYFLLILGAVVVISAHLNAPRTTAGP